MATGWNKLCIFGVRFKLSVGGKSCYFLGVNVFQKKKNKKKLNINENIKGP